jgi:hypothetical protein
MLGGGAEVAMSDGRVGRYALIGAALWFGWLVTQWVLFGWTDQTQQGANLRWIIGNGSQLLFWTGLVFVAVAVARAAFAPAVSDPTDEAAPSDEEPDED